MCMAFSPQKMEPTKVHSFELVSDVFDVTLFRS